MKYVLIDAVDWNDRTKVILVKKKRPDWQAGRWNLTGGHIEEGEDPIEAVLRELREETGIHGVGPVDYLGEIDNCCLAYRAWYTNQTAQTLTDEEIGTFWLDGDTENTCIPAGILQTAMLTISMSRGLAPFFNIQIDAEGKPNVTFPGIAEAIVPLT